MEVTKWLKPSMSASHIGDSASVQARNANERKQHNKRLLNSITSRVSGQRKRKFIC